MQTPGSVHAEAMPDTGAHQTRYPKTTGSLQEAETGMMLCNAAVMVSDRACVGMSMYPA